MDALPDACVVVGADGRIAVANRRAEEIFGVARRALEGAPVSTFLQGAQALRPGAEPLPVEIDRRPFRVGDDAMQLLVVRARAAAVSPALEDDEQRFRRLVEGVDEYALFLVTADGRVATWNAGAERIKGYRADEIVGEHVSRFFPREDVEAGKPEALLRDAATRGCSVDEGPRVRKDGTRYFANVVTSALYDERGRVRAFAKLTRDVTEAMRLESERAEATRWLRAVIDASPIGLFLFRGAHGEHVEANEMGVHLLGRALDPKGGVAQYAAQILHPDGSPVPLERLPGSRALQGETIREGESYVIRRPDGTATPVLVTAAPVMHEGRLAGAVIAFEDMSDVARLERQREEWTSIIAHDLRQPLNVISMFAALLARGTISPKDVADTIGSSARRLNRMIRDLLDLSGLEASRLEIVRRRLDVEVQARAAAARATTLADGRTIAVRAEGTSATAEADPDRLDQIFDNLIGNAIRYGEPGTPIHVEVVGGPAEVAVAVSNRGPGIPPDRVPELFQRFRRCTPHVTKRDSIGLGLYITKGLVEAHGGRIEVQSTPGETTTFRFTLPA